MGQLMSAPSPFSVAREIGTNLNTAFREQRDENAIERILSDSMQSGDPRVLQNNIGKILSQVSPERQGPALQYIQGLHSNIVKKQEQQQQFERERQAGLTPGLAPAVQAAIYKETQKNQRLSEYGLGSNQTVNNTPVNAPANGAQINANDPNQQESGSIFRRLSEDQLIQASGAPDREIAEPAKQELKRRQELEKANKSNFEPESEKLEAKRVSELATEIENEYKAATNEDIRLDRMGVLDKEGNVSTPALIKALDFIGLPIGILSNPATEEYRKLESDFIRDVSKVFPGGKITNYEVQAYLKTIPTLLNSTEGRKSIIRNRKLLNEAKKARYEEYKKIIKENSGKKPQNLGLLLEERIAGKISSLEDKFISGIEGEIEKFQQPIRMLDPEGNPVDIPPSQIERALKSGARFS